MPALALSESAIYVALRSFLLGTLSPGVEIVRAQDNRVPQPRSANFIIFTPLRSTRLATNMTIYTEIQFFGFIDDDVLTVSAFTFGSDLLPNMVVSDMVGDVSPGTTIVNRLTTTGLGTGTFRVSPGGQTIDQRALYSSTRFDLVATEFTVQLDVYGPNAWANVQTLTTYFQSSYGAKALEDLNAEVAPLYCDPARQVAFIDGERQWEDRWMIELALQVNPTLSISQQAATQIDIGLVPTDLLN